MMRKKIAWHRWMMLLALVIGAAACGDTPSDSPMRPPNVIFILADDLGVHDLSVMGSKYYETPYIDRIAREGTIFEHGYACSRVCSPSRASIMTGKFTARHGITDWIGAKTGKDWRKSGRNTKLVPPEYLHALPADDITLAEAFKSAGYVTFFAGKWHLGGEGSWPEDHGFDFNKGGWDVGSPIGGYFSPWQNPNLPNQKDGENLSMRLAHETADFISDHQHEPFFAYLSFYAVHGPIQTTEAKWRKYRDKAVSMGVADHGFEMERRLPIRMYQDNPVYAGLVEQMDDAVGVVLGKLDELGLDKNTIIVFTSDNGGVASGDAFATNNSPFRGGKGYQWEGGIREPYFIKVPWIKNAPRTVEVPATGADFFPTLLDLAGLPLMPDQHMDGVSLKPLFMGKSIDERPLYWHYPHYGNQGGDPSSIIRQGPWKLIMYWEDDSIELYNLDRDPYEQNEVGSENPEIRNELAGKLKSYLAQNNAGMPQVDPDFDKEAFRQEYQNRQTTLKARLEEQRRQMLSEDYLPNEDWWGSKLGDGTLNGDFGE